MTAPTGDLARAGANGRARREADLLLWCLRNPADSGNTQHPDQPINWADLLRIAHRHGVLPHLDRLIQRDRSLAPPASLADQLAIFAAVQAHRNAVLIGAMQQLSERFSVAGIRMLVLRAAGVLSAYGGDPLERESEELDVLVFGDVGSAERLLAVLGYEPEHPLTRGQLNALRRSRGTSLFRHANGTRLHIYYRVTPRYLPLSVDPAQLWERHRQVPVGEGGSVPGLSPEDLLLVQCVHGAAYFWDRLAWIKDVARLVSTARISWPVALDSAHRANAERPLLLGLQLASELLAAPVPADLRTLAASDPDVQALATDVRLRLLLVRPARMSELERARFRLRLQHRLLDRVRYCLTFAFQPDLDDFRAAALPDRWLFLYYFVRPTRLLSVVAARALKRRTRAPFLPSPAPVVERMLAMADLRSGDVLFDLGSGDGRIVIEAAATYGVRSVGVELDRSLVAQAQANARSAGVEQLVSFIQGDAMDVDLSEATVVTLWTVPDLNLQLRPRLSARLRPGARLISHGFDMGDWAPDRTELVPYGEEFATVYRWTIGETTAEPGRAPLGPDAT